MDTLYTNAGVWFELNLNQTEFDQVHTGQVNKYCIEAENSWNEYYSKDTNKTSIKIKRQLVDEKKEINDSYSKLEKLGLATKNLVQHLKMKMSIFNDNYMKHTQDRLTITYST